MMFLVTPFTGVWIEIASPIAPAAWQAGHSLHGSVDWNWLKKEHIVLWYRSLPSRECGLKYDGYARWGAGFNKSLPSRECGLKSSMATTTATTTPVTPFTGVWIEIAALVYLVKVGLVTPFTGVWIEISNFPPILSPSGTSLPSRECGLKSFLAKKQVWINFRHSLHGSVDWNV